MMISIESEAASDSWGFVGVVYVGTEQAYRTLEAFATPSEAQAAAEKLMAGVLGELLAGREWRAVRDETGRAPLRQDFNLGAMGRRHRDRAGRYADPAAAPEPRQ